MNTASEAADIPGKSKKVFPIFIGISVVLMIVLKMGFFFLLIGMLPTLLSATVSKNPGKYVISTVAALNFAGLFPELVIIFLQGGTPRAVIDQLSSMSLWLSVYGAAALGWALVWIVPALTVIVLEMAYSGRMRHMEHRQKKLEEEWGAEVAGETKR